MDLKLLKFDRIHHPLINIDKIIKPGFLNFSEKELE